MVEQRNNLTGETMEQSRQQQKLLERMQQQQQRLNFIVAPTTEEQQQQQLRQQRQQRQQQESNYGDSSSSVVVSSIVLDDDDDDDLDDTDYDFTAMTPTEHEDENENDNFSSSPASSSCWKKAYRHFQTFRYVVGGIVNNKKVQLCIVVLISINALMMGIATFDFGPSNEAVQKAFERSDEAFLVLFTVEIAMQLIYHGWRLFLDGWLLFDFLIIVVSYAFSSIQIVRAFRIFRALRLLTRIKVMKNLMIAVFGVFPRIFGIFVLLMLIMYIFAVMFTQLFKAFYAEGYFDIDYFGSLDLSLFTLFQIMTLDQWGDINRMVMEKPGYEWSWILFVSYIWISAFIVMNMIVAVICDAISLLHAEDKAKLLGLGVAADSDDDGGTDCDDSRDSGSETTTKMGTQEKMQYLEKQVTELGRIQEQTLQTLEHLSVLLQEKTAPEENDEADD